jgi:hypothetical protein
MSRIEACIISTLIGMLLLFSAPLSWPQLRPDGAKFVKGTCGIPPKTTGFFYPIPYDDNRYLFQVSSDEGWLSLRDPSEKVSEYRTAVTLIHVNKGTTFKGFQSLAELKSADHIWVRFLEYLEGGQPEYIASYIERVSRPSQRLEGVIKEISRAQSGPIAIRIGWFEWVALTRDTLWTNLNSASLLIGHHAIIESNEDTWLDLPEGPTIAPAAHTIGVPDIDAAQFEERIYSLSRNATSFYIEGFPAPIVLMPSQVASYEESKDAVILIKARRQNDGKWLATDVSFSDGLVVNSRPRADWPVFSGVFWWQGEPRRIWPSKAMTPDEAKQRLEFTYRRERKYHPFLWVLTFGFLSIFQRDIIDVEFDQGKSSAEFCEFEIGKERLETSLRRIKQEDFGTIH